MNLKKISELIDCQRYGEAKRRLRFFLLKKRENVEALYLLSIVDAALGDQQSALKLLFRVLNIRPNHGPANYAMARLLSAFKRHEDAMAYHNRAASLLPNNHWTYVNRGISLAALQKFDDALSDFNTAISIYPGSSAAYQNKGRLLLEMGLLKESLDSLKRSLDIDPDNVMALSNKSACLLRLGRHDESLEIANAAIRLKSDCSEAWDCKGSALYELKDYGQALLCYEKAIEYKADYCQSWYNRANVLIDLKRYGEALVCYEDCIALCPDYSDAQYNRAILLLHQKDFLRGFDAFSWRWKVGKYSSQHFTHLPECSQDALGGSILLLAEQGLGDEVFFAGMLPLAISSFKKVTISADSRLQGIFQRSFPSVCVINRELSEADESRSWFDYDCKAHIGDLGHILKLELNVVSSSRKPYLFPDIERMFKFKDEPPFDSSRVVCGLSWKSANEDFGVNKSISLAELAPEIEHPGLAFVNLQYGDIDDEIRWVREDHNIEIWRIDSLDLHQDIDGLLSLIEACDVIVTVSNVTAHLAGSIGKTCCLLLPYSRGKMWYWHLEDTDSIWYPSIKIFRQTAPGNWGPVISQVSNWLRENYT